jgi:uncharacterized membrane protein
MNIIQKYKKDKSLINCVLLLCLFSILNTIQGYVYGKFGLNVYVFLLEVPSLITLLILLHNMICTHKEGKCTTVKK